MQEKGFMVRSCFAAKVHGLKVNLIADERAGIVGNLYRKRTVSQQFRKGFDWEWRSDSLRAVFVDFLAMPVVTVIILDSIIAHIERKPLQAQNRTRGHAR